MRVIKGHAVAGKVVVPSHRSVISFILSAKAFVPILVVEEVKRRLLSAGFKQLDERQPWTTAPNGMYFMQKNRSSVIAFAVGGKYKPGNGYSIVGAHTDSPCLKVANFFNNLSFFTNYSKHDQ